eukprot:gnl/Spiro4/16786_TR9033_c0_g1_i1.p1 gnl/Spiro4/16786_TR9033_c0_g1~~gnl/Spiro4/16786_TR9033_c0_g1_i1.p1  ORF type:complete len:790 (-),score=202.70 gnl/Spiro4/16786_TR9033_c0_g1_i1:55-2397(-)
MVPVRIAALFFLLLCCANGKRSGVKLVSFTAAIDLIKAPLRTADNWFNLPMAPICSLENTFPSQQIQDAEAGVEDRRCPVYNPGCERKYMEHIRLAATDQLSIFGDIHGFNPDYVGDALAEIEKSAPLASKTHIVFLGDLTDRGAFPAEIWELLLAKLSQTSKKHIVYHVLRGNHEDCGQNFMYKTDLALNQHNIDINSLYQLYTVLPTALVVSWQIAPQRQKRILMSHGGIEIGWMPKDFLDSGKSFALFDHLLRKFNLRLFERWLVQPGQFEWSQRSMNPVPPFRQLNRLKSPIPPKSKQLLAFFASVKRQEEEAALKQKQKEDAEKGLLEKEKEKEKQPEPKKAALEKVEEVSFLETHSASSAATTTTATTTTTTTGGRRADSLLVVVESDHGGPSGEGVKPVPHPPASDPPPRRSELLPVLGGYLLIRLLKQFIEFRTTSASYGYSADQFTTPWDEWVFGRLWPLGSPRSWLCGFAAFCSSTDYPRSHFVLPEDDRAEFDERECSFERLGVRADNLEAAFQEMRQNGVAKVGEEIFDYVDSPERTAQARQDLYYLINRGLGYQWHDIIHRAQVFKTDLMGEEQQFHSDHASRSLTQFTYKGLLPYISQLTDLMGKDMSELAIAKWDEALIASRKWLQDHHLQPYPSAAAIPTFYFIPSDRGMGFAYGAEIVKFFLEYNNINFLFRGHDHGHAMSHRQCGESKGVYEHTSFSGATLNVFTVLTMTEAWCGALKLPKTVAASYASLKVDKDGVLGVFRNYFDLKTDRFKTEKLRDLRE